MERIRGWPTWRLPSMECFAFGKSDSPRRAAETRRCADACHGAAPFQPALSTQAMSEEAIRKPAANASVFARVALLFYAFLIVYASWYPFSGWHSSGLSAFAYLSAPFPYYWTVFDLAINIFGYAPLGVLAVFALYPNVRGSWTVPIAVIGGALLSGAMEAVLAYLPRRVASSLGLLASTAGVLLGAIVGGRRARAGRGGGRGRRGRARGGARGAS